MEQEKIFGKVTNPEIGAELSDINEDINIAEQDLTNLKVRRNILLKKNNTETAEELADINEDIKIAEQDLTNLKTRKNILTRKIEAK